MPAKIDSRPVRDFSKLGDAVEVPDLTELQARAYEKFLQQDVPADKREPVGLEGLLREVFPEVHLQESDSQIYGPPQDLVRFPEAS